MQREDGAVTSGVGTGASGDNISGTRRREGEKRCLCVERRAWASTAERREEVVASGVGSGAGDKVGGTGAYVNHCEGQGGTPEGLLEVRGGYVVAVGRLRASDSGASAFAAQKYRVREETERVNENGKGECYFIKAILRRF